MAQQKEWYHGRIEAFKPTGERVQDTVPLNSISVSWVRNHLGGKATELIRRLGFRVVLPQADPDVIELKHPTKEVVSIRLTVVHCAVGDSECDGGCITD